MHWKRDKHRQCFENRTNTKAHRKQDIHQGNGYSCLWILTSHQLHLVTSGQKHKSALKTRWTQEGIKKKKKYRRKYALKSIHIRACAKRCSARTIHFLVLNASSGLSFLWTNLTLSERVCIKEIIKINLTPKVSSELVKYENLHPNPGRKSAKEGWTFQVHRFSCRLVCIFLL